LTAPRLWLADPWSNEKDHPTVIILVVIITEAMAVTEKRTTAAVLRPSVRVRLRRRRGLPLERMAPKPREKTAAEAEEEIGRTADVSLSKGEIDHRWPP
jgi:hypothetical protein